MFGAWQCLRTLAVRLMDIWCHLASYLTNCIFPNNGVPKEGGGGGDPGSQLSSPPPTQTQWKIVHIPLPWEWARGQCDVVTSFMFGVLFIIIFYFYHSLGLEHLTVFVCINVCICSYFKYQWLSITCCCYIFIVLMSHPHKHLIL